LVIEEKRGFPVVGTVLLGKGKKKPDIREDVLLAKEISLPRNGRKREFSFSREKFTRVTAPEKLSPYIGKDSPLLYRRGGVRLDRGGACNP